jgi:hypothetical protein
MGLRRKSLIMTTNRRIGKDKDVSEVKLTDRRLFMVLFLQSVQMACRILVLSVFMSVDVVTFRIL